nr:uncharacterized protein LOC123771741 [Procambarus clarkii]
MQGYKLVFKMKRPIISPFLVTILLQSATSILVEKVVVPPVVLAGRRATLECHYQEDGDKLYSLKWWRGDEEFYQYIPPIRKDFPATGVTVNLTATNSLNFGNDGQEVVVLDEVGLDTAGVYKCEVLAEHSFETVFKQANMTVIYEPDGPPVITTAPGTESNNITAGQRVFLICTSPPASPPPVLTWSINERRVDPSWVTTYSPVFKRKMARAKSRLEFTVSSKLIASGRDLAVKCSATQTGMSSSSAGSEDYRTLNSYEQSVYLILRPSPPLSFWGRIFSSGSSVHVCLQHHHNLLLLVIAVLAPPALATHG